MNHDESCASLAGLLVEYADGELSEPDARHVAAHLAECPDCRAELRRLERSLELARDVWQESAARAAASGPWPMRAGRRRVPAAACLAVLLLIVGLWVFSRPQPRHQESGETVRQTARIPSPAPPVRPEDVDIEIAAFIAREGRSARLAAAARLLATQPGLERYRNQAESYLARAYRDTAAAAQATTRTPPPPPQKPESKEPES